MRICEHKMEAPKKENYSFEELLFTFVPGWKSPISAVEMASCRMYWLKSRDAVKCCGCQNTQSDWVACESVIVQHAREFPDCPTVQLFTRSAVTYYFNKSEVVIKLRNVQKQALEKEIKQLRSELKKVKDTTCV